MTTRTRHIATTIAAPASEVYDFIVDARNLPRWAEGLAGSEPRWNGSAWTTESPMGTVTFAFAPPNALGVADHDVTLPSGAVFRNPLRVIDWGAESEVVFSLRQADGVDDEAFEADAATIEADLERLRGILEGR